MNKGKESGMALPMVLWTIALLAGIVVLLVGVLDSWISEETRSGKLFQARQQALSGIAVAMVPTIKTGDPILQHSMEGGVAGYSVVIKDESGLINPNAWLGVTPDRRDLFQKLFTSKSWGLDMNQSAAAADGLYDWQSPNPFRSLHGAKQPDYEAAGKSGLPPGTSFVSAEEMSLVLGFEQAKRAKTDWITYFTTYSGTNGINILYAPKGILKDLLDLSDPQADAWITLRNGKDGIEGTEDDFNGKPPADIPSTLRLMGLRSILPNIASAFTVASWGNIRRIESTGYCNGVKHRITVVTSGGTLLGWSEQ
jgi:hypothetical protein